MRKVSLLPRKHCPCKDRDNADRQDAKSETRAASSGSGNQAESQDNSENTSAEKTPTITNPRWEDENGKTLTKALVGDGNDDFVTELSAAVQEGKICRKWKVAYTEDNDDTDSQQELEEKGYTLPEYAFTVESSGVKSEESGQLDVRDCSLLQNFP